MFLTMAVSRLCATAHDWAIPTSGKKIPQQVLTNYHLNVSAEARLQNRVQIRT